MPDASENALSKRDARRVYDRIGAFQDTQAFYEDRPIADLIAHMQFERAESVFEFGCGTGRLAEKLLSHYVPPSATYRAVDLSPTMVDLARERTVEFRPRIDIQVTDGEFPIAEADAAFDRFVCTYVLDLLSDEEIAAVLKEAHRLIRAGGLLGIVGLTTGTGPVSRLVSSAWAFVQKHRPTWVGGCRPMEIAACVPPDLWRLRHHAKIVSFGVPSEIVVAERI